MAKTSTKTPSKDLPEPHPAEDVSGATHEKLSFQQALEAVKSAERIADDRERKAALAKANRALFAVQQGSPVLAMTADDVADKSGRSGYDLRMKRLTIRARSDRDLAFLLSENEALKKKAE